MGGMHDLAVLLALACVVRGAVGFGYDAADALFWLFYTRHRRAP